MEIKSRASSVLRSKSEPDINAAFMQCGVNEPRANNSWAS